MHARTKSPQPQRRLALGRGRLDPLPELDRRSVKQTKTCVNHFQRLSLSELILHDSLISKFIKRIACALSVFCAFVLLYGCSDQEHAIESRRASAAAFYKSRLQSTTNPIQEVWSKEILAVLAAVDAKGLAQPTLASSALIPRKNGGWGMYAFWVESMPTVDAVELRLSRTNTIGFSLPIPGHQLRQMESAAKVTVVFGMEKEWDADSDLKVKFDRMAGTNEMSIRLIRGGIPLTEWKSLHVYK
ncbi:MAG: hypothetical protein HY299_22730 [Verrucomicrobia bacterium]|nr:hypothetical protein [Verrucomicrobiota bacterium]